MTMSRRQLFAMFRPRPAEVPASAAAMAAATASSTACSSGFGCSWSNALPTASAGRSPSIHPSGVSHQDMVLS